MLLWGLLVYMAGFLTVRRVLFFCISRLLVNTTARVTRFLNSFLVRVSPDSSPSSSLWLCPLYLNSVTAN